MIEQISVKLPRLLDKDLNEVGRLRPQMQSIELNITPLSTASMTLEDGSGSSVRSFVEIYTAKGSAGIFRVSMPEESYGGGERLNLEHGICVLDDAIVPGDGEIKGKAKDVFSKILEHQTTKARGEYLWTLGTVEMSGEISVEHDGTKTLEMLTRAVSAVDGYMLTFDQSTFPWVVHVRKKPEKIACEGRLSRNVRTIRKTLDDSDLCTRVYCPQLEDGYVQSDTVGTWGVVEQSVTLNDDTPQSDVRKFCERYVENRKNPKLAIELDADEWYALTGEALDRFEIGDVCRLALPDYGVALEERIVSIRYTNVIGLPEKATVSLANQVEDMTIKAAKTASDVSSLKGTATRYGNRIGSSEKNITNLQTSAEGFKEVDDKIVAWFSSVEVDLDATEEGARFGALASYAETYDLFEGVATRISEAELVLYGGPGQAGAGLIARVNNNAASIAVTATELETLARIKADRIELDGFVTADEFSALKSDLANVMAGTIQASLLYTQDLTATNTVRLAGHTCEWLSLRVCTRASLSKEYATIPGSDGVNHVVIGGVSLSTDFENIMVLGT